MHRDRRSGRLRRPGGACSAQPAGLVPGERVQTGAQQFAGLGVEDISVASSIRIATRQHPVHAHPRLNIHHLLFIDQRDGERCSRA
ncbi:MAG TPA: hypothetical protein DEH11_21600 [Actinobacteria bacterium]|nr:hypothetical protein [Actinomycetota bacterium]